MLLGYSLLLLDPMRLFFIKGTKCLLLQSYLTSSICTVANFLTEYVLSFYVNWNTLYTQMKFELSHTVLY